MAQPLWQPSEKAKVIFDRWYPNVSKEKLSIKDLRFVVKALKTLSSRWEEIGLAADVIDLDAIKKEYRGTYRRLIAVINSWLSGSYHNKSDVSSAPSWWKIVDVVADDIGGADPNLAKSIAQNWQVLGKDSFTPLAMSASSTPLSCSKNAGKKLIGSLLGALGGVASKWFEIATLLGIPIDKLHSFKEECDGSTETCFKRVIEEWLSGRYTKESGYPTPSLRVLVDVVEHQAGGADPSLASTLAKLNLDNYLTEATETSTVEDSNPEASSSEPEVNQPSSTSDISEVNKQPSSQPASNSNSQKENSVKEKDDKESESSHKGLEQPLKLNDHFDIQQYLNNMDNRQLRQLGLALGLHYPTLKRMESMPDDLIHAWLLRQDSVTERSGEPTYSTLAKALEDIGQVGIAQDVRNQKYAKQKLS